MHIYSSGVPLGRAGPIISKPGEQLDNSEAEQLIHRNASIYSRT
jgi:hypothetical protein